VLTRSHYDWQADGPLATIRQHSIAKHEVLRAYLIRYIQTLVISPHQEELRLTFVDGFAGGGIYQHQETKTKVLGSPFVFLEAAREAEALINLARQKPLRMNVDYFFVEEDPDAFCLLGKALHEEGYGERVGVDIRTMNNRFEHEEEGIRRFIRAKNPRNGRSIFFLDQYGYKEVPAPLIRSILSELPAAEVILTFSVDAFINYANDSTTTSSLLQQIGIPNVLRGRTIDDIKRNEKDFRLYIQSCLYRVRIPAHAGHRFRSMPVHRSG
jgi:three-Cys-motif partner protein